jgi:RNA polymerase sigma-70 factor, ECF subfamily
MQVPDQMQITDLLVKLDDGNRPTIAAKLMPLVYDELRRLAGRYFRHERHGHTLQPTALVHEAYIRMVDQTRVQWEGRTQFFAVGAVVMRRVLVDYARTRQRKRRGGGRPKLELDSKLSPADMSEYEVLEIHEAIEKLSALDEREAKVVELRFFAGLSVEEVAEAIGVSKRTVEGDWKHAKAWLRAQFAGETES